MKNIGLLTLCLLLVCTSSLLAQDECPSIVQSALDSASAFCSNTERNQLCYGNLTVTVQAVDASVSLQFETPGDIVDVHQINSIMLNPMDITTGEWGVGLLRLQANLPDTLPGENVTLVLIGDTQVDVTDTEENENFSTQAFYFRSGIGDAPCAEAPNSGLLIQTPAGAQRVELAMNAVNISLGSTIFLQAEPSGLFSIYVVEGEVSVETFNVRREVPEGQFVSIPLNDALQADGEPTEPEDYDVNRVSHLPIGLLERDIVIAGINGGGNPTAINEPPPVDFAQQAVIDPFCSVEATTPGTYLARASYGFDPANPQLHEEGLSTQDLFNVVGFDLTINGEAPPLYGDRFMITNDEGTHIQQLYDLGLLTAGTYTLNLNTSVNGQAIVTETCTYTLED